MAQPDSNQDLQNLKKDIQALKDDLGALSKSVRTSGGAQIGRVRDSATEAGREYAHRFEDTVKERPGQSVLMAFGAGLLTSALVRRRG